MDAMQTNVVKMPITDTEVTQGPTRLINTAIKALMTYGDITQEDLAQALGMTRVSITHRLSGRTRWSLDEVIALEQALHIKQGIILNAAYGKGLLQMLADPAKYFGVARLEGLEPPTF